MHGVKYQDGQLQDIGVPNTAWSGATAINDAGRILGYYYDDTGATQLFQLDPVLGFEKLPNFGSTYDYPQAINNADAMLITSSGGQIEQYGDYLYNTTQTLIYQNGNIVRLPGLGHDIVTGVAINDLSQVAGGFSFIPGQESHAFVWDPTYGATDLGTPGESSAAFDINNRGVVVGSASINNVDLWGSEAFIYDPQNGRRRLSDLLPPNSGWSSLRTAAAINDAGQILGIGTDQNGFRIYLMTPVPEPTTFGLTALALLAYLRRRHLRTNRVWLRSGT
jgi:probable HAF family extracellular repeat protein